MQRIFSRAFMCEEGHITAGETKKLKCDAKEWNLEYVKGKRKREWLPVKTEAGICGKNIVSETEIPEKLDFTTVWDYNTMHGFLIGQKLDASFMISLQEELSKMWEKINGKK